MMSAKPAASPRPSTHRARHAARHPKAGWAPAHDETLRSGIDAIGLAATPAQADALGAYARLLLKWNRTYNLLGTDDPDTILESHLLDSLAVVPALERWLPNDAAPLVDVGSGGGLPGIPISIMRPGLPVILVEPVGKKAAFLRQAVAECRLEHVTVREARLQELPDTGFLAAASGGSADAPGNASVQNVGSSAVVGPHFICRAFTSLANFASLCVPRLTGDSLVMAMKAARVEDEIMAMRAAVPQMDVLAVEPLSIPGQGIQRSLVVMRLAQRAVTEPATTTSGA